MRVICIGCYMESGLRNSTDFELPSPRLQGFRKRKENFVHKNLINIPEKSRRLLMKMVYLGYLI